MLLNIFDGYGKIRTDLEKDQATIEALPDDHRATLFACIAAVNASTAGSERVVAARKDVRTKEAAYNEAAVAFERPPAPQLDPVTNLPINQGPHAEGPCNAAQKTAELMAALRAVSAAQHAGYVPAKVKTNKLKAAMEAAHEALLTARLELQNSTTALRHLERAAGEAIDGWRKCLPVMSRDTLMRDHVARGNAERLARVKRGEPAEPPKIVPEYQSEYDRVRGASKRKVRPLIGPR